MQSPGLVCLVGHAHSDLVAVELRDTQFPLLIAAPNTTLEAHGKLVDLVKGQGSGLAAEAEGHGFHINREHEQGTATEPAVAAGSLTMALIAPATDATLAVAVVLDEGFIGCAREIHRYTQMLRANDRVCTVPIRDRALRRPGRCANASVQAS